MLLDLRKDLVSIKIYLKKLDSQDLFQLAEFFQDPLFDIARSLNGNGMHIIRPRCLKAD